MYLFYPCIVYLSHKKCFLDEKNMNEVKGTWINFS